MSHATVSAPTAGDVRVRALDGLAAFEEIAEQWDELTVTTGAPVSLRSYAVAAWARHRPGPRLVTVLVERGGRLVAAAPLMVRRRHGSIVVEKAGVPGEAFRLLHRDSEAAHALATAVVDTLRGLGASWSLHLSDLPEGDRALAALIERWPHAVRSAVTPAPCLDVHAGVPLAAVLSRNVRSATNKARNRAIRSGTPMELTWHTEEAALEALLPELVDLHIRRNEQIRGHALLRDDDERLTYLDTLRGHARSGVLRVLTARIDGHLAAFAACLVDHRRMWVYSNYAAPEWLHLSPGTVSNAEVVRAAHDDPDLDVLDWGAGIQRYKLSGGAVLIGAEALRMWPHAVDALRWRLRQGLSAGKHRVRLLLDAAQDRLHQP